MTLAMLDSTPSATQPTPPPPPATLEETGLHPDTLAQILLKTLVSGEASGTSLSGSAGSKPSSASSRSSCTTRPSSSVFPALRADANGTTSEAGKPRSRSRRRISLPTAPVAPTMATRRDI